MEPSAVGFNGNRFQIEKPARAVARTPGFVEAQMPILSQTEDDHIESSHGPDQSFMGEDAQLAAAIAHLKQLVKEKPVVQPDAPALPDKQFKK